MFGELSKLFDRNFAVGFFLPVVVWFSTTLLLIHQYVHRIDLSDFQELDYLVSTTVLGLLCLIGGIVLLAINRDLYRFMEGYGSYNPMKLFGWFEKRRYQKYKACVETGDIFPVASEQKQNRLLLSLAEEFPDEEDLLLPTPFGNALRSFESFPRVMYGLDSIPAWGRLLTVIPREYIELLDAAKAHVDLWVNLGMVFILLLIEYVGLVYATGNQLNWWVVGLWFVLGIVAPIRATSSAREWGHFVKSAFDVFAPRLREALGIELPKNRQEEFQQWQKYSRALSFRSHDDLPELKK
jgi:hypothetical protein